MACMKAAQKVAGAVRAEQPAAVAVQPRVAAKPLLAGRPVVADASSLLVGWVD